MKTEYILKPGIILSIAPEAATIFSSYRQQDNAPEAGGILLGREYLNKEVRVELVTIPTSEDLAGPTWFERSHLKAQTIVDEAWNKSNGEMIYLGEWHTHPQNIPSPSSRDRAMIRNMRHETMMEIDFLLLIIVGRTSEWIGIQTRSSLRQLKLYEQNLREQRT